MLRSLPHRFLFEVFWLAGSFRKVHYLACARVLLDHLIVVPEIVELDVFHDEILEGRVGVRINPVEQAESVLGVSWRLECAYEDEALEFLFSSPRESFSHSGLTMLPYVVTSVRGSLTSLGQ